MSGPVAWQHNALADDLAQYLRSKKRMVWTDMQLGPSGSARPDVYTIEKSYSRPMPTAYECKISRSDLRSDTTSGKWKKYLAFAGAVVFAVPDGLCTPAEIPTGCGLIVRKDAVWRNVRKATRNHVTLPMDACMKLLIDGVGRCEGRRDPKPRSIALWEENQAVRQKFGAEVAACARDLVAAQSRLAAARADANSEWDRMRAAVDLEKARLIAATKSELETWAALRSDVLQWLGMKETASTWAVEQRLRQMKAQCDADARVQRAEADLSRARHAIESALHSLTPKEAAA